MREIIIALGGGGVRGIAHIGAIRCLQDNGFKIRGVAGTSAGGLVGSVFAAGFSTAEIEKAAYSLSRNNWYRRQPQDRPSLLGVSGISNKLLEMLGDKNIEDFDIPFVATAVSLSSGNEIILNKGKAVDAVLATIAIPGVLPIREVGGKVLMDGGVLDPVPVIAARRLNPSLPIIAIVLHKKSKEYDPDNLPLPFPVPGPSSVIDRLSKIRLVEALKIFARSVEITTEKLSELRLILDKPDVIIRPMVGNYNLLDKVDPDKLIKEGEIATLTALPEIEKACSRMSTIKRRLRYGSSTHNIRGHWEETSDLE